MTRVQLEHVIRAAATIADVDDILAARWEKDLEFTKALARHAMVDRNVLERRLGSTSLDPLVRSLVMQRIQADFSGSAG